MMGFVAGIGVSLRTRSASRSVCERRAPVMTAGPPAASLPSEGSGTGAVDMEPFGLTANSVRSADAMEFFRHREGRWESWRVTHHLAFRRAESGESSIEMTCIDASDERIVSLCKDWEEDPAAAIGGCYVTWQATMAWDQEGENHEGSTVFALVPDEGETRKGKMLRDRGYAEIVPIAGTYYLDDNDDLCLETPYDGGAVEEKFSFDGPDVVNRVSTVRRFGGFATATFATERRIGTPPPPEVDDIEEQVMASLLFGAPPREVDPVQTSGFFGGAARYAAAAAQREAAGATERPSTNSAFGSGFTGTARSKNGSSAEAAPAPTPASAPAPVLTTSAGDVIGTNALAAAEKEGIDLAKVPPSMRDDFVNSFIARNK